jgi:hypothetical protein
MMDGKEHGTNDESHDGVPDSEGHQHSHRDDGTATSREVFLPYKRQNSGDLGDMHHEPSYLELAPLH